MQEHDAFETAQSLKAKLRVADWNDVEVLFVRLVRLLIKTEPRKIATTISPLATLPAVRGQEHLAKVIEIAALGDIKRLKVYLETLSILPRIQRIGLSIDALRLDSALSLLESSVHMTKNAINTKNEGVTAMISINAQALYHIFSTIEGKHAGIIKNMAYSLMVDLEDNPDDLSDIRQILLRCEQRIKSIRRKYLHSRSVIPTKEENAAWEVLDAFSERLMKAGADKRRSLFLKMCGQLIKGVSENQYGALDAIESMRNPLDYPSIKADESIHPFLRAIVLHERGGELKRLSVKASWKNLVEVYRVLPIKAG